jgi:predicted HicB family RNase H-like nuclease
MKLMEYKGYRAAVEYDAEDELLFGRLLGVKDFISFDGQTVSELKTGFREAVDDYLDTCAVLGKAPDKPFSGNLMLRVDPAVHSKAAIAAESAGKSLNQWGEEVLRAAAERELAR